jgi:hypothetical protein
MVGFMVISWALSFVFGKIALRETPATNRMAKTGYAQR